MKYTTTNIFYVIIIGLVLGTLALGSLVSCSAQAQEDTVSTLDTILKTGVLRVGTTGDWNPMSMINSSNNEYEGYDIDLMKKLASDMGVDIEFVKTDWKSFVAGLVAKRYDMSTSVSYNLGRAKTVGYSMPIMSVDTVALINTSEADTFSSWKDLNNANVKVAVTLGTVFDEVAGQFLPDATLLKVEPPAREYQEVLSKNANASITSNLEAALLKKAHPDTLEILSDSFPHGNILGLMLPRNDQEFINYVNVWLQLTSTQLFLDTLHKKWLE